MRKAFVLLSGGVDSTTCLYKALFDYRPEGMPEEAVHEILDGNSPTKISWVEALGIDYGQRHKKETDFARFTCEQLGIPYTVINIGNILSGVMLTDPNINIPKVTYDEIQGVSPTYVPFRNGTMLSVITAYAQKWINDQTERFLEASAGIYFGAHAEDAHNWAYPDCTPEFIGAMANAIFIGSYMKIRLHTPIMWSSKTDVVLMGNELGVPYANTWSCYAGGEKHCGECPTCYARHKAFKEAGILDPTTYVVDPSSKV